MSLVDDGTKKQDAQDNKTVLHETKNLLPHKDDHTPVSTAVIRAVESKEMK